MSSRGSHRFGLLVLLAWTGVGQASAHAGSDGGPAATGAAALAAARELENRGDHAGAALAYDALGASTDPGEAAAGLFEAARLHDAHLADPAGARARLLLLAQRHPTHRLALRARNRADELGEQLASGGGALARFNEVLRGYAGRPRAESQAMMRQLLVSHPDFALADRALVWLGDEARRDGDLARAIALYREGLERFPRGRQSAQLRRALGDALTAQGHYAAAKREFELLGLQAPGRDLAQVGLRDVARARGSRLRLELAGLYLGLFVVALGVLILRSRPWRQPRRLLTVPTELRFYVPVAVLFVLAGRAVPDAKVALALTLFAVGGTTLLYLNGVVTSSWAGGLLRSRTSRLAHPVLVALAVFALAVCVISTTGLEPALRETLQRPDRP